MSSTALARPSPASATLTSRIASPTTPSQPSQPLPQSQSSQPSSAPSLLHSSFSKISTPQPGTWSHPSLDEIARRQNASVFNGQNVNRIVVNALALLTSLYLPELAYAFTPQAILALLQSLQPYAQYTIWACRSLLLLNIAMACAPLFRTKDEIQDIPLTPSQRALLGLKPSAAPCTPGQQYITPPRYARSSTPRSNPSAQRHASGSPISTRPASPSSLDRSTMGQSRFASGSPYASSPLMQKAIGGSAARRLSYGTSSPVDLPSSANSTRLPNTHTVTLSNGKASVGLNSKWLYERGRDSPNGKALFT